jgi:hypothetical protein
VACKKCKGLPLALQRSIKYRLGAVWGLLAASLVKILCVQAFIHPSAGEFNNGSLAWIGAAAEVYLPQHNAMQSF